METLTIIIFIVSFIIATIIVNKAQQIYMKIIGAETMFFSGKKKLIAIFIIGLVIAGLALKLFGVNNT